MIKEGFTVPPADQLLKFLVESSTGDKLLCANCDKVIFQLGCFHRKHKGIAITLLPSLVCSTNEIIFCFGKNTKMVLLERRHNAFNDDIVMEFGCVFPVKLPCEVGHY